jgi:hypothetical protein
MKQVTLGLALLVWPLAVVFYELWPLDPLLVHGVLVVGTFIAGVVSMAIGAALLGSKI